MELDSRQRAMLQEMGVSVWMPASVMAAPAAAPVAAPSVSTTAPVAAPLPAAAMRADLTHADWVALGDAAQTCQACGLCAGRSHSTLLAPDHAAGPCDWLVLGDPPDEDEDASASPFAGSDGVLLDNMLRALGVQRINGAMAAGATALPSAAAHRAYVTNVVKCRPAHGQIPQAAELLQCAAFLRREIALVQPRVIVAMGRFAQQLLLLDQPALAQQPLGKLRGTVHHYHGIAVVLTYHPKTLMRTSADKAKAWADWCLAVDAMATY